MAKDTTNTSKGLFDNPKKVGNVSLRYLTEPDEIRYADGAEPALFEIFSSPNPQEAIRETLSTNPTWPMVYHLSSKRSSLVDWYDFKPGSRVLEIGAGCGAITEALVKKPVEVTSLEIDPVRARVNAERNKAAGNLEIIVGNMDDFKPKKKFDYVICVGVLEYSGKYIDASDPYATFAGKMKEFLSPEGICLIAIENKLGLKYLAGAGEDHTGIMFDSINNYPNSLGMKTFSRHELSDLLHGVGFENQYFYFPHPDYKLPHAIFSDDMHPGKDIEFPLGLLPTRTPEPRKHLFSEQAFAITLEHESLYPQFANSFLAEVSPKGVVGTGASGYVGQNDRKDRFKIETLFTRSKDGNLLVTKRAKTPAANEHVLQMVESSKLLSKLKVTHVKPTDFTKKPGAKSHAYIQYPMIEGVTLERALVEALADNDLDRARNILESVFTVINAFPTSKKNPTKDAHFVEVFGNQYDGTYECVKPGVIDLNLDNFITSKSGKATLFDYEWIFDFYAPKDLLIVRMLASFFGPKFNDMLRRNYKHLNLVEVYEGIVIPEALLDMKGIKKLDFKKAILADAHFQNYVSNLPIPQPEDTKKKFEPRPIDGYISFDTHLATVEGRVEELTRQNEQQAEQLTEYEKRLDKYRNHPAVRVLRKIKRQLKD